MSSSQVRLAGMVLFACALFLLAIAWPSGGSRPGVFSAHAGAPAVAGQLVVQFHTDTSAAQRQAILASAGATLDRELTLQGFVTVSVPAGREEEVGRALASSPAVASAERDIIRQPAAAPNDPFYPEQWNMPMIGMDAARDLSDGSGVTVAIVDTGVAFENYHNPDTNTDFALAPDLATATFVDPCDATAPAPCWCAPDSINCQCETGSPPCINPARDVHPNDDFGHGTHIAGTVAEATNNGLGAAGIAPGARIMPVKVCTWSSEPGKYGCPTADLADGINYAVQAGADVINVSITGLPSNGLSSSERNALARAEGAGVIVIAASGNEGTNVLDYPAAVTSVVAVGSVGLYETRVHDSNYGQGEGNKILDLVAPGGDPLVEGPSSVIWQQSYSLCTRATNYTTFPAVTACRGTSMAAGHVSGVAALVKSKFPALSLDDLRADLKCSAKDLGDPGEDSRYGAGLVQADKALQDVDDDGIPDCLDPQVVTPTPTFTPPPDDCQATPTPTATSSPTPTVTPSPTPTATPSPSPTPTLAPSPTATPTATDIMAPTDTPPISDTPTPTPTTSEIMPSHTDPPLVIGCGDVDCNGQINPIDALGVVRWYANALPVASCIGLGYVTCDNNLDAADAVRILAYSGGLVSPVACSSPR